MRDIEQALFDTYFRYRHELRKIKRGAPRTHRRAEIFG